MTIGVKNVSLQRTARDQIFLPAILEGLLTSARHFFKNTMTKGMGDVDTIRYGEPDVDPKTYYPARYRGVHRLMFREDGSVRCVACMCCSTVCPAKCIYIVAEDRKDDAEKAPESFVIDELKCVVCGLCVEACPCDAIRMDSRQHMTPTETREAAVLRKVDLMSRGGPSVAVQGGLGADYRAVEPAADPRFADSRSHGT
ncbi:MAG: NADH-quinone oxidoreductase subunit I [Nannocystaceae bacterium]|nr:NADH-quinone oxidoreductase subunit I [Nannocystaceae bacterium]